jgi:hypothetical protein
MKKTNSNNPGKGTKSRGGRTAARRQRRKWDQAEIRRLRQLYPSHSNPEIARRLRRSLSSVIAQAFKLNLKKSRERLVRMGKEHMARRWGRKRKGGRRK